MKRVVAIILTIAMLLSFVACRKDKDNNTSQKTELAPGEIPEVGQLINGFRVTDVQPGSQRDITFVYMEHEKTGAKLVYAANDDVNRNFTIGFRTPALNDKGTPHIFEHSVHSGSEKYPDPSLALSMILGTYTSYLNALTYPAMTCYLVSSLSEEQLFANVDYTLNGVLHPLILTDEMAMMREAYHYELDSADAELSLLGTVYSEMQGTLTIDKANSYDARKLLFPGSYLANISGGDPDHIPELTYDEIKDFHSSYYHPSNSVSVLYGKLDLKRFLKYIDEEFFSAYERMDVDLTDKEYVPFEGFKEEIRSFPVSEGNTELPVSSYVFRLPGASREEVAQMNLLINAMYYDGGIIENLRIERMPSANIYLSYEVDTPDPEFMFMCTGSMEDQKNFKQLIDDSITYVIQNGCDDDLLRSIAEYDKYSEFYAVQDVDYGVKMAQNLILEWSFKGDIDAYRKHIEGYDLRTAIDEGQPLKTFKKYMEHPAGSVFLTTVPEQGALEKKYEELAQSLSDKKAAMSQAEIEELVQRTADYKAWVAESAQNSMLSTMKAVNVQDIPEELLTATAENQNIDGMRFVSSVLDGDISYVAMLLDTSTVPVELIQPLNFFMDILPAVPTQSHSSEELTAIRSNIAYGFRGYMSELTNIDSSIMRPMLFADYLTTEDNLEASFEMLEETFMQNVLPDTNELQYRAAALYDRMRIEYLEGDPGKSVLVAKARLVPSDAYQWKLSGTEYLSFLKSVAEMDDVQLKKLQQDMKNALSYAFTKKDFTVLIAGSEASIEMAKNCAERIYKQLPENIHDTVDLSEFSTMPEGNLALVIDGTVYNNFQAINVNALDFDERGKLFAAELLISDKLLMPTLRFERGAYVVQAYWKNPFLSYVTCWDPNLKDTYDFFEQISGDLFALEISQEELDGYILSALSEMANYYSPLTAATTAIYDAMFGENSFEARKLWMKELKSCTPEDMKQIAKDVLETLSEQGVRITVGGLEQIEANSELFDTIDYSLIR